MKYEVEFLLKNDAELINCVLFQEEEQNGLIKGLTVLRKDLNNAKSLAHLDPAIYLAPFLEIIRSETTGTVTSLALSAVNKIISYGIIGTLRDRFIVSFLISTFNFINDEISCLNCRSEPSHDFPLHSNSGRRGDARNLRWHRCFLGWNRFYERLAGFKVPCFVILGRSLVERKNSRHFTELFQNLLRPTKWYILQKKIYLKANVLFNFLFYLQTLICCFSELVRKTAEHCLKEIVHHLFSKLPHFKDDSTKPLDMEFWNTKVQKLLLSWTK